jgi:aminoglycoside phosphotransferase (APT) family kinase protein
MSSGTSELSLDAAHHSSLFDWMESHVEGFRGPLRITNLPGGNSNPTFEISAQSGRYIMRRKPSGKLLPSAHAVDREFRVLSALHRVGFPAPRPYCLCEDDDIIGTAFYIMEFSEGRIIHNALLPDLSPEQRRRVYLSEIDVLASLHTLDYQKVGLTNFGRGEKYLARQIKRWTEQYRASQTRHISSMKRLIGWLPSCVPAQLQTSIVHGDFRLDNLVLTTPELNVKAVLDWELSTIGDPIADISYFLMHWRLPTDGQSGLGGVDLSGTGIPTAEEAAARYFEKTQFQLAAPMNWYLAYNLFRCCAICQGVGSRVMAGNAPDPRATDVINRVEPAADVGWNLVRNG